jgi:hypothetical protein
MVATTTTTEKGLSIKVADSDFTLVDILVDLDMRTGTPVDETGWLNGNTGGSYPGSLTGFQASNSDGNAVGSLRMVTVQLTSFKQQPLNPYCSRQVLQRFSELSDSLRQPPQRMLQQQ